MVSSNDLKHPTSTNTGKPHLLLRQPTATLTHAHKPAPQHTTYIYLDQENPVTVTRGSDGAVTITTITRQPSRRTPLPTSNGADYCLWKIVDADGDVTTYTYPGQGSNRWRTAHFGTAPNGNLPGVTYGYTTWYVYNDAGQVTTEYVPVATTGPGQPNNDIYASLGYIKDSFVYDNGQNRLAC